MRVLVPWSVKPGLDQSGFVSVSTLICLLVVLWWGVDAIPCLEQVDVHALVGGTNGTRPTRPHFLSSPRLLRRSSEVLALGQPTSDRMSSRILMPTQLADPPSFG